jgi:heterodisulfide reductase subunit B
MKEYTLYPGCSLEAGGAGGHYLVSLEAVAHVLDIKFHEVNDWNCCGSSFAYLGGDLLTETVLAARNLALAEPLGHDVVAPCSACYKVLNNAHHHMKDDPELMAKVNKVLGRGGLSYKASIRVRHILDVLANDIGLEAVRAKVVNPLRGLKVAGHVGCQTIKPHCEYDNPEAPKTLDALIEALGATAVKFPLKMRCCGAGLVVTEPDVCYDLDRAILQNAVEGGAQLVVSPCPMCQMNLEAYQGKINDQFNTNLEVPVIFFTQLMAVAFGLDLKKAAALNYALVPVQSLLQPYFKHQAAAH